MELLRLNAVFACAYGLLSALSLPLGACLGAWCLPGERVSAGFLAFGSGCLTYAVGTTLFGEMAAKLEHSHSRFGACVGDCLDMFSCSTVQNIMCVVGALSYLALNSWLGGTPQEDSEHDEEQPYSCAERSKSIAHSERSSIVASAKGQENYVLGGSLATSITQTKSLKREPSTRSHSIHASRIRTATASFHQSRLSLQKPQNMGDDNNVAMIMWFGLLLDSIPESLMLGFMTNQRKVTTSFLVALFVANLPEAFSAAAMMKRQGMSMQRIVCMWGLIFILTGALAMTGSIVVSASERTIHVLTRDQFGAGIEGFAGGLMFAMIAVAMLPEALHGAGHFSGLCYVVGFVSISMISTVGFRIG